MSIVRYIDIRCDGCSTQYDDGDWRAADVRESARMEGWQTGLPGGRDLCPECRSG